MIQLNWQQQQQLQEGRKRNNKSCRTRKKDLRKNVDILFTNRLLTSGTEPQQVRLPPRPFLCPLLPHLLSTLHFCTSPLRCHRYRQSKSSSRKICKHLLNVDFIYVAVTRPCTSSHLPLAHLCANINISYLFILRETFKVEPPAGP